MESSVHRYMQCLHVHVHVHVFTILFSLVRLYIGTPWCWYCTGSQIQRSTKYLYLCLWWRGSQSRTGMTTPILDETTPIVLIIHYYYYTGVWSVQYGLLVETAYCVCVRKQSIWHGYSCSQVICFNWLLHEGWLHSWNICWWNECFSCQRSNKMG